MNIKRLNTLLKKEEGPKLDFKLKIDLYSESGKKEFAKDISAIANSKGGRGSITDTMRKHEILHLFEENLDLTIETCPVIKSDIKLLDNNLIDRYFRNKNITINDDNRSFILESAGIIFRERESKEEKCTYGGLIVFSEMNSLCIANNLIKIINKLDDSNPQVKLIEGSLITMIIKTEEYLKSILPTDYPIIAISEAIKNGILYRDYTEMERCIEVVITKKSIVIESPGTRIIKSPRGEKGEDVRRNMWIYEKIMTLDDSGIFINDGRGFNRMKKAFKGKTKTSVKFISLKSENNFKVILPGIL